MWLECICEGTLFFMLYLKKRFIIVTFVVRRVYYNIVLICIVFHYMSDDICEV